MHSGLAPYLIRYPVELIKTFGGGIGVAIHAFERVRFCLGFFVPCHVGLFCGLGAKAYGKTL
jgi:hypothetical protein